MKRKILLIVLTMSFTSVLGLGTATSAAQEAATWTKVADLFEFHVPQTEPACSGEEVIDGVNVVDCAGLIHSFDGLTLSVAVRMPKDAAGPLPTLMYLHAFGSNRGEFNAPAPGWRPPFYGPSFAARGYLVVMPAARGMGGSCGLTPNTGPHAEEGRPQLEAPHGPGEDFTCSKGYTHLNDREYETRDVQHLLGLLVDHGVADPERLFATGFSYGGVQTWMLATSGPWTTPNASQEIQLAAAVPIAGGTSALNTFAPNGRASDELTDGRALERPHGIPKLGTNAGLATLGHAFILPRWNDVDPSEKHSYAWSWLAFWLKGEPFDTPEGEQLATMLRERKSAFPPDDFVDALGSGAAVPVPILAVQGWNDALFTPVETLQMYRALTEANASYPISMILADIGHATGRGRGTDQVKEAWQNLAIEFLDRYAFADGGAAGDAVVSMSTTCAPPFGGTVPESTTVTAADWDSIHSTQVTLKGDGSRTTKSGPPNLIEELSTDPANVISEGGSAGCITQLPGTYSSEGDYSWTVPPGGYTVLGLPKFMADYALSGTDATVVVKLWDVDGQANDSRDTRTLVTRGLYRLALAGGDSPAGMLKFQLFGNHYHFAEGHTIQLEISQTDVPFLQPDRLDSSITYNDVKLELPIAR